MLEHIDTIVLVLVVATIYLAVTKKRRARKAASNIKDMLDKAYVPRHEYRTVDARDFPKLDLSFYDASQRTLEREGFRFLVDEEDVTLKNTFSDARTFLRVMLSRDGLTTAAMYHPRLRWWMALLCRLTRTKVDRTVDFETEFTDGSFLCTSNAECAAALSSPRQVHVEYLPVGTPVSDILQKHKERLREYLAQNPELQPLPLSRLDQVHESQHRLEAIKAAHRKSVGGITREELRRCGGSDESAADDVYDAIQEEKDPTNA